MNPITCYVVASVMSLASLPGIPAQKLTFGARQITTELVGQKYSLCDDGSPIEVTILSVEAPTQGVRIGPFEFKSKKTIVKTKVVMNGKEYYGTGKAKTNVSATLMQLQDENLPFERTEFSSALKKSLENALN
jgi:hypothetical protein